MKPTVKVVAFDCDGVMFDSREANRAYYNHLLEHFHLPAMTPQQLAYAHMHTVDEALAHLIPDDAVRNAAHAYRKLGLPVAVTGGQIKGAHTAEGTLMKAVLEGDFGVPVTWVEKQSRTTFENALYTKRLLQADNIVE